MLPKQLKDSQSRLNYFCRVKTAWKDILMQIDPHRSINMPFWGNGGVISQSSKKQELITLSTAESEYVAAVCATKEAIWL